MHNNLRNVYIEIFYKVFWLFVFFIRTGVADSDNVPDLKSRETDRDKHMVYGCQDWSGPKIT